MALSAEKKLEVNAAVGSALDARLSADVSAALGPKVDLQRSLALTRALNTGIRAKVGATLGVGAPPATGAAGTVAPSGALSLGSSLGTRASAGSSSGGAVSLGVSLSGGFGVGASAGLDRAAQSGITSRAGAAIKASLVASLDSTMLGLGLSASERSELRTEIAPAIEQAVGEGFQTAFGPELGYPHAQGVVLLGCEVTMRDVGAWRGWVEIDWDGEAEAPTGPFVFDIDGVEFRATVVPGRSGAWGGRMRVYVVGGAGGLDEELPVQNYAGGVTRIKTVVDDILRASGETLSSEADATILATQLPSWQRSAGPATAALDLVLAQAGATWRVLRDGTVWVGVDSWPEVEPSGTVLESDWADGVITVAPDFPTLVPGITVREQKISEVRHELGPKGLRTHLHAKTIAQLMERFTRRTQKESEYAKRYRCRVTRQNANGTVDVLVDDERMKGRGIGSCRVRAGFPGATIKVPAGARCLVGWDDGEPTLPYVDGWESGTAFTSIDIG
jgi:hypothetical protein